MARAYQTMMYLTRRRIKLEDKTLMKGIDITCCEECCSYYYEPRKT
jgi:hypothetical protein